MDTLIEDISTGLLCVDSCQVNYNEVDEQIYSMFTNSIPDVFIQQTEKYLYKDMRKIYAYVVPGGRRDLIFNSYENIHTIDEATDVLNGKIDCSWLILYVMLSLKNSCVDNVICVIPKENCVKTLLKYAQKWDKSNRTGGIYGRKFDMVSILFRKILDYYLFNKKEVELKTNKT